MFQSDIYQDPNTKFHIHILLILGRYILVVEPYRSDPPHLRLLENKRAHETHRVYYCQGTFVRLDCSARRLESKNVIS